MVSFDLLVSICYCCIRFIFQYQSKWLDAWKTSPKWYILCRVWLKP